MARLVHQPKSINGDVIPDSLIVNGNITADDTVFATDVDITDDLSVGDDLILSGNLLLNTNTVITSGGSTAFIVQRYVSDPITQVDIVGGGASEAINLSAFPPNAVPIAGYVVTSVETTSSSGDTTGLLAEIGPAADPNGYVTSVSIFGAAGRKETATAGVIPGCFRAGDTLQITLTATGPAPDTAHINQLSVIAVIYYLEVAAE